MPKPCSSCGKALQKHQFARPEWKRPSGEGTCKACAEAVHLASAPGFGALNDNVRALQRDMASFDPKTNPNCVGWKNIGKLGNVGKLERGGAASALFRGAVAAYLDEVAMNGSDPMGLLCDADPDEVSLWSQLSLHLRLHLLAEVAVGVLVPGAALPPETVLHYAAFAAIHEFAYRQLDLEIEEAELEADRLAEAFHGSAELPPPVDLAVLKKSAHDMMRDGDVYAELDRKTAAKVAKKIQKSNVEGAAAAELAALVGREQKEARARYDPKPDLESMLSAFERSGPAAKEAYKVGVATGSLEEMMQEMMGGHSKVSIDDVDFTLHWRALVHNKILEDKQVGMLPDVKCEDSERWSLPIRMQKGMRGPEANVDDVDRELVHYHMHAEELCQAAPGELARHELVLRLAQEANLEFADEWTPELGAFNHRVLMVLAETHELPLKRPSRPIGEVRNLLAAHADGGHELLDMGLVRDRGLLRSLEWLDTYHDLLDGQYGDLEVMVEAVRSSSGSDCIDREPPGSPSWQRQGRWKPDPKTKIYNPEVSVTIRQHPDEWLASVGAAAEPMQLCSHEACAGRHMPHGGHKMKKCSVCKVARYCSEACQRAHWKAGHKRECKDIAARLTELLEARRKKSTESKAERAARASATVAEPVPESQQHATFGCPGRSRAYNAGGETP